MKKILFVINSLTIGGSEKSLVSLLNTIDYSKYEIDLMMFKKGEEFDVYIPKEVNVLEVPQYYKFLYKDNTDYSLIKKIEFISTRVKTSKNLRINSLKKTSVNTEQVLYKSQDSVLEILDAKYDVAIAYSQGMPTYFVADKVCAGKKIAWINCDYETTRYDKEFDERFYNKFDKIVAVSETIRNSIIKIKPQYKNKIEVILDIVNPNLIEKMADEEIVFEDKSYTNILTVARIVIHHKGYDTAVKAAKLLKDDGYKFRWYVVGDGEDKKQLYKLIKEYDVEDVFILLGQKENPYPYMKNCDIYVQPSKKEGFGLTVVEAKILKKLIVCTRFNTVRELINNEQDGLIVNHDPKDVYYGVRRYLEDYNLKKHILRELENMNPYTSVNQVEKIYNLL